jgi:hypothetical protein
MTPDPYVLTTAAPGTVDRNGRAVTLWRVHARGRRVPLLADGTEADPPVRSPDDDGNAAGFEAYAADQPDQR